MFQNRIQFEQNHLNILRSSLYTRTQQPSE